MTGKYAYRESSDNDKNFFTISIVFEPKLIGIIKKNSTQIINQDNSSKYTSKQKAEIKKEFEQFEKEFHGMQIKSVEFSISLRQYYTEKTLMLEYHAMFEYMMSCFLSLEK